MNNNERRIFEKYLKMGYDVIIDGLPDQLLLKDGKLEFVEIKGRNDKLGPAQRRAFEILKKHNIPVRIERGAAGSRITSFEIPDGLYARFRQEIVRKYGGKKGDLARALEQAIKYFLVLSPVEIKMTKEEGEELKEVLLGNFLVRDVVINKIMDAMKLMKDLGVLHVEG